MRSALITAGLVSGLLLSSASLAAPLPALPGANEPAPSPPSGSSGSSGSASLDFALLRRGVVQVEQQGRPMAVGTVLSKDGRVLTSLSALGGLETPEIRYADGTVVKTKVGHKDKAWDLALLIPQSGKWLDGLMPTDADPTGSSLQAFLPKAGKLGPSAVGLKGKVEAHTKDGETLTNVLDFDLKGLPSIPGAPVINPDGRVIGILAKACKDAAPAAEKDAKPPPCTPITIGVPVHALRGFLMKTPTTAVAPAPWLGLGGQSVENGTVKGVRVMGVAPGSPAAQAGLKATGESPDIIVAVEGQPVETPEQLAESIAKRAIGQTVKLLVFSQAKFREVPVTLRAAP